MRLEIPLPEGEPLVLPVPDDAKDDPVLQSLGSLIDRLTQGGSESIALEFECGACCKKVLNGRTLIVIPGFVVLLPATGDFLLLKVFCDGCLVEKQRMRAIIVNRDNLKAIEIGAVQVDP